MLGTYDVAKLTEFDCWGCCLTKKCTHDGSCVAIRMAILTYKIIMDGWNYEVSPDYNKPFDEDYSLKETEF